MKIEKKSEIVMCTHTDTHLGTKPKFHYIKMQQSMLVVKDYLLTCFAVTWTSDKIFMGKNMSSLLRKQNKIYLTIGCSEYSQS